MLLYSLVIQPQLRKISNTFDLKLNMFYADDGKIGGRILEVHKALNVLRDEGPPVQYHLQAAKTLGYGRSMNSTEFPPLFRPTRLICAITMLVLPFWEYRLATTATLCSISMTNLPQLTVF
jgi:hypothetical protein